MEYHGNSFAIYNKIEEILKKLYLCKEQEEYEFDCKVFFGRYMEIIKVIQNLADGVAIFLRKSRRRLYCES